MELRSLVVVEDVDSGVGRSETGWLRAAEQVANKPILHHVLAGLRAAGINEAVIASSAQWSHQVRECVSSWEPRDAFRVRYVQQDAPLDLGDALKLAAPMIDDAACLVHQATGLLSDSLEPLVDCLRTAAPDLVVTVQHESGKNRHLSLATQQMLHLAELRPERTALNMAGVCLFGPGALRRASAAWRRTGGDTDLTGVAERIAAAGGTFRVLPVHGWRQYTGDPLDLLELNRIALDRLEPDTSRSTGDNGTRIEGRVWIHKLANVRTSVIVGPAVIGPGAWISDAYIGPYTSIGAGARVEGAEIERSIVAADARIMHTGGRLVTSVVGRDARIFRDFSLPRALRLRVGPGTVVALC